MGHHHHVHRRGFLRSAAAATISLAMPGVASAALPLSNYKWPGKTVILLDLGGGNDAMNMVAPVWDKTYFDMRSGLCVRAEDNGFREFLGTKSEQMCSDARFGSQLYSFHPSLKPLSEAWANGDMTVALGVGYLSAPASHFLGADMWDKGVSYQNSLEANLSTLPGWVDRIFSDGVMGAGAPHAAPVDGVSVVAGGAIGGLPGEFFGGNAKSLSLAAGRDGVFDASSLINKNLDLTRFGKVYKFLYDREMDIVGQLQLLNGVTDVYQNTTLFRDPGGLSKQLRYVANLLVRGIKMPFVSLAMGGFDTHTNQMPAHRNLMNELAMGLADFRKAMIERGLWKDIVILVHSEFGRTLRPNSAAGFDHGAGAAQLILGGSLGANRFVGRQVQLSRIESTINVLPPMLDFRSLYTAILIDFLGMPPAVAPALFKPPTQTATGESSSFKDEWVIPAPIFPASATRKESPALLNPQYVA